jgi:predicted transcriptional regulator of viral defense system
MHMVNTQKLLKLARRTGVISLADARGAGIHHEYLRRMCADGQLVRTGRGLYSLPDADITIHHGLAQAAKAVPKGIVCLLSALRFHEIGTQAPYEVWIAIDRRAALPRIKQPSLRIMRFSGEALTAGVQDHTIEGVHVRIYGPAKTVTDCFKYRNKIGLDVALEALRESLRERKCTVDELWHYAKICRVANVMRPYMEAMV